MISKTKRTAATVSRVISFFPILWLGGVFSFYFRAKNHLGYWPNAYIPDPKSMPFEFHHGILMMAVFPLALSIPGIVGCWLYRYWMSRRVVVGEITVYVIGWIAIACVMSSPGVDFVSWFLD